MLAFPGGDAPPPAAAEGEPAAPKPVAEPPVDAAEGEPEVSPPEAKKPRLEAGEPEADAPASALPASEPPALAPPPGPPVMPDPIAMPPGMEAFAAAGAPASPADFGDLSSRKARLVWTQELHNRFINALSHLGLKQAVPKNILAMMNVEGMTRENVASHLQKYRLYLKKMGGFNEKERVDIDSLQRLHEQNVAQMAAQQAMQQSLSGAPGGAGGEAGAGGAGLRPPGGAAPPFSFAAPGVDGAGANPSSPMGALPAPHFPAMFGLPLPAPGAPGQRPILPQAALTLPAPPFPLPVGAGPAAATSSSSKEGGGAEAPGSFLPLMTEALGGAQAGDAAGQKAEGSDAAPAGLQPPPGVAAMPPLWHLPSFRLPGVPGGEDAPGAGEEGAPPTAFLPQVPAPQLFAMWQGLFQPGGLPAPPMPDGNGGLTPAPFSPAFPWPLMRLPTPAQQQGSNAPEGEPAKEEEGDKPAGEAPADPETQEAAPAAEPAADAEPAPAAPEEPAPAEAGPAAEQA